MTAPLPAAAARWQESARILAVRVDNLGDVLMTTPALTALARDPARRVTLLASRAGAAVAGHVPALTHVIACDALPERFAAVADALAARGLRVVLTGTEGERGLVGAVRGLMRHAALELAGRTGLWTLGALIERARLLVCNDTGVQHVAAALGTPSVAISSGADVARWAPLDAERHRVLWRDLPCRPCAHRECPSAHECARGVGIGEVVAAALAAVRTTGQTPEQSTERPIERVACA